MTKEKAKRAIENYFADCMPKPVYDSEGNEILGKNGEPIEKGRPPTLAGIAHLLGLASKKELLCYPKEGELYEVIADARLRCEELLEARLYDKEGINGAKFVLQNAFEGWGSEKEKEEQGEMKIVVEIVGQ